jgi:2-oxo-4-hydroxy-4-carboxy-5-ureidoimidazoline decarboxylase
MNRMTIEEINSLSHGEFVARLGWVFEHSPWVAERTWVKRPFLNAEHLHAAMMEAVERGSRPEQLGLLRAHPDLGARARVGAPAAAPLSEASATEQKGAGLDQLTIAEHEGLMRLNSAYHKKFGFPFIYAVKGAGRQDILKALELRLETPEDGEFREALRQVYRIARFRLEDAVHK